ncbi:hypothetical protein K1719_008825 [Acacia pycnantha]|nr:hypothetical protein K1719_008825 [Acacia pycnantha]
MASLFISSFILLLSCLLPVESKCPTSFDCGYLGKIQFPWTTTERTDCGLFAIQGCHDPNVLKTLLTTNGTTRTFKVFKITHTVSPSESTIVIRDMDLQERLRNRSCEAFSSNYTFPLTLPPPALASFKITNIGVFLRCNRLKPLDRTNASFFNFTCVDSDIIYGFPNPERNKSSSLLSSCSVIQFPIKDLPDDGDPFTFITSIVLLRVRLSDNCSKCIYHRAGRCQLDPNGIFNCDGATAAGDRSRVLKLGLGIGLGIGLLAILMIAWFIRRWCYLRKHGSYDDDQIEPRNSYSADYSISDPENRNIYLGVPQFSCKQLQEATNNFDQARVLGDGGFGIVYYGKLSDGREIAVKRLYEHNYRRVEQFRNEVKILARLRHKNLVSLYGCTSRRSQDLLLVYEYISNGTVASHLEGNNNSLSTSTPLPWPIRLKIAIETASALVYLHASDIIHRDVKTNNILVDSNFNVKVADFGLSRLFPNDASHVSTAPQGTPGYVDPEYYQYYQLTSKSDVYSFGVVLIELISSKPAVDISRSKDEVNLSSLAMKKIQESAFMELVDPCLGIEMDGEVKRMVVSVGELAFQCLQRDKDLRPSMEDVLEALKKIQSGTGDEEVENLEGGDKPPLTSPPSPSISPEKEDVGLLKKVNPPPTSPNTVTDKWTSESSTPNASG